MRSISRVTAIWAMRSKSCLNDVRPIPPGSEICQSSKPIRLTSRGTWSPRRANCDASSVAPVPGRFTHGPRMIAIGGLSSLVGLLPEAETWCAQGLRMIRHVLDRHVIGEDSGGLRRFDFVEFVDRDGAPWIQDGRVVCDPGHAMEFCGLTARFLLRASLRGIVGEDFESLLAECRLRLPWVFLQAFENGYKPDPGGVVKTFDLTNRRPLNDDMPWWPLPEAIRAAWLLMRLAPDHPARLRLCQAAEACADAFFTGYRTAIPGVFLQTRDRHGAPSGSIPATPDADPCYHTGLSLIDLWGFR